MRAVPHPRESERLRQLEAIHLLDSAPERGFDEIVELAEIVSETPIALISLLDEKRQWFKARRGMSATESPRELAFCSYAILQEEPLIVTNTTQDDRFTDHPWVTGELAYRFYAGFPLRVGDGLPLGTLCVIDTVPRTLTGVQLTALSALARQVADQIDRRLIRRALEMSRDDDVDHAKMTALGDVGAGIAHEINTPLGTIHAHASVLLQLCQQGRLTPEDVERGSRTILRTVDRISKVVDGLQALVRDHRARAREDVTARMLIDDALMLSREKVKGSGIALTVHDHTAGRIVRCNPTQVSQVLLNLLNNAADSIREKSKPWIHVESVLRGTMLEISVTDCGDPLEGRIAERIFDRFFTTKSPGKGTGLGLSISREIASAHRGTLTYDLTAPHARFVLSLPIPTERL